MIFFAHNQAANKAEAFPKQVWNLNKMTARRSYPILAYHGLHSDLAGNVFPRDSYSVEESTFRDQMAIVAEDDFRMLTTDEILKLKDSDMDKKSLAITFDDGYESVYEIAFPILKEFALTATVFVISGFIGHQGYLKKRQILEMADHGIDIQSHSVSHPCLLDLPEEGIVEELSISKKAIEEILGKPIRGFAIPGGLYNHRICELAQDCGYDVFYTSDPGLNRFAHSTKRLKRLVIKENTNQAGFRSLANGEGGVVLRQQCRAMALGSLKSIFGLSWYNKCKRILSERTLGEKF